MLGEPQNRISERALTVWRITAVMITFVLLLIAGGTVTLVIIFDWPLYIAIAAILVFLLFSYLTIYLIPLISWRRWRYEVREQEIELQHGVIFITRTLIPMVRVQHVDTRQGPLLRKYRLATVSISTAATVHEIPALKIE